MSRWVAYKLYIPGAFVLVAVVKCANIQDTIKHDIANIRAAYRIPDILLFSMISDEDGSSKNELLQSITELYNVQLPCVACQLLQKQDRNKTCTK